MAKSEDKKAYLAIRERLTNMVVVTMSEGVIVRNKNMESQWMALDPIDARVVWQELGKWLATERHAGLLKDRVHELAEEAVSCMDNCNLSNKEREDYLANFLAEVIKEATQ